MSRVPFDEIPVDEWDRLMAVNLRGIFLCCRAVVPHMKERQSGKIVNISSGTVFFGSTNLLHYVTSKAGVIGLTRGLARELGEFNINVNAIAPGLTISMEESNEVRSGDEPTAYSSESLEEVRDAGGLGWNSRIPVLVRQRLHDGADHGCGRRRPDALVSGIILFQVRSGSGPGTVRSNIFAYVKNRGPQIWENKPSSIWARGPGARTRRKNLNTSHKSLRKEALYWLRSLQR